MTQVLLNIPEGPFSGIWIYQLWGEFNSAYILITETSSRGAFKKTMSEEHYLNDPRENFSTFSLPTVLF